jgi:pSer/pThr/pTyr-binding forkhead associated (FHA) protein
VRVREGKGAAYDFELKNKVTVIGRGTDTDLRLTDQSVSRRHAEIRVAGGATMLNDLQSTNGTTVNGTAVTTKALADGDEIRLGETTIVYQGPRG